MTEHTLKATPLNTHCTEIVRRSAALPGLGTNFKVIAVVEHIAGDHYHLRMMSHYHSSPKQLIELAELLQKHWPAAVWRTWS